MYNNKEEKIVFYKKERKIKWIKRFLPLGINVFGVNGLVTVIDVCAMVLDGNAVICVLPKASTKLTREKKQEEKKHISKLALP